MSFLGRGFRGTDAKSSSLGSGVSPARGGACIALTGLLLLPSCGSALAVAAGDNRIAAADDSVSRSVLAAAPAGHMFMRDRRIALSTVAGASFGGTSQPSVLYGGEVLFHPVNELGVGVWGAGASPLRGDGPPSALRGLLSPEVVVVPAYGKGSLFEQVWFDYNLHLDVGGAWLKADARPMGTLPTGAVGVGLLTYWRWGAADWSLGIDYRTLLSDSPPQMVVLSLGLWPQPARSDDEDGPLRLARR